MGASFPAPGKGPWELETTHFSRPVARFTAAAYVAAFPRGFAEGTARYGLLIDHLKPGISNGFLYMQPVAFMAPEGAMKPPPGPVLWLLTRLHPKMRARVATSARAFEQKQWRTDLDTWDNVDKPTNIEKHLALQMVDVSALTDEGLIEHLRACLDHMGEMIAMHHKYTATSLVAPGHLIAKTLEWTGAPVSEVCQLLRGSSPISNGFAADELTKAGDAIAGSPGAAASLRGTGPATQTLQALFDNPDVGPAVRAYVEAVQHRSVGYDVGDFTAGEMPDLLVSALATASQSVLAPQAPDTRLEERLRSQVPPEHVAEFDEALVEARLSNRIRDERGAYSDGWATGLGRRAVLEAGRRLHDRGLLLDPQHAPDLELDEIAALLRGQPGPTPQEAAAHHAWRTTHTVADAPPFLNAMPPPPPSADLLPAAARPAMNAVSAVMGNLFAVAEEENTEVVLHGLSVNQGTYEGTARLVESSADFGRITQGDVLVTRNTSPYFNVVLPLLGAIVTDRGGQLSHAAIVAREYGIPGVVGTRDATTTIHDGARVRVDGTTGEVHVLSTS
jgi:pyruvate,water dikinase